MAEEAAAAWYLAFPEEHGNGGHFKAAGTSEPSLLDFPADMDDALLVGHATQCLSYSLADLIKGAILLSWARRLCEQSPTHITTVLGHAY